MIKALIDGEGAKVQVELAGELTGVVADLGLLVGEVYGLLKVSNPKAAEMFRLMTIGAVGDPSSPVWSVDRPPSGTCVHFVAHRDRETGS